MVQSNLQVNQSRYFKLIQVAIAVMAIIITIEAVSVMMFASLGVISNGKFSYVLLLQLILAVIGATSYLTNAVILNSKVLKQVSFYISTILCGVLLGFYYGGSYTDNNPQYGIFGAIAGGIIF